MYPNLHPSLCERLDTACCNLYQSNSAQAGGFVLCESLIAPYTVVAYGRRELSRNITNDYMAQSFLAARGAEMRRNE